LHYLGEAGCPDESQFLEEVTARVRRRVEWTKSGALVQLVVIIRPAGDHANGTLEVVQHGTEPTRREFNASSCAEVGSALALVAALALDPNARTEELPSHLSAPVEPAPPTVEPPRPAAAAPAPLPKPAPMSLPASAPPRPAAPRYAAWLGVATAIGVGYAPKPLGATGFSLGVRREGSGWSPGFQLTPLWSKTGTTGPQAPGGAFSWALGRLEGCPLQFALTSQLAFEPCAALEIGRLWATGAASGVTPVSADRWWLAAGVSPSLHLRWGSWFARLGGLVLLPATRDEFVFHDPERSIHQPSAIVAGASLGLGFQFGS
jgi:hypothetical protein